MTSRSSNTARDFFPFPVGTTKGNVILVPPLRHPIRINHGSIATQAPLRVFFNEILEQGLRFVANHAWQQASCDTAFYVLEPKKQRLSQHSCFVLTTSTDSTLSFPETDKAFLGRLTHVFSRRIPGAILESILHGPMYEHTHFLLRSSGHLFLRRRFKKSSHHARRTSLFGIKFVFLSKLKVPFGDGSFQNQRVRLPRLLTEPSTRTCHYCLIPFAVPRGRG